MEIEERQKNIRDDRMRDCRSFGSNYHPCSQSRKISIGIMVDSALKAKFGATKEKEVAVANAEKVTSSKENSIEGKRESQGVRASNRGKQTEAPEQEGSPWITTRSKSPTVKTVHHAKQTSNLQANSGRQNKLSGEKVVAKDTLILQAVDDKQKKFDRVTYQRRGDGTADRVEKFSFATAQGYVSDKCAIENKTDKSEFRSSEGLKTKLWEILGTVSSPNKQLSNSHSLDQVGKSSKLEKVCDAKGEKVVKSRQNSDTIETDSENLDDTIRRPVTRSLTRKKAPSRMQQKKFRTETSSRHKQNNENKNVFYYQERLPGSLPAVNGGSSISKMKNERKSSKIEPRKISILDKYNADKIPQATDRKKIQLPPEKTSSLGNRMRDIPAFPPQVNGVHVNPKNGSLENDFNESPVARSTDEAREHDTPALSENADQHEDYGNPSFNNIVDQQDDLRSPTFGAKSPIKQTSPSSPPKTDQLEMDCRSPASANTIFTVGNIQSFKTWQTSKPDFYASNVQTESSDDEEELKDSPTRNSAHSMEERDGGLSKSPSQERDSTSSEDDLPFKEGYNVCMEDETLFPEFGTAERPKNNLHSAKRLRGTGCIKFNEFSPISPTPQGKRTDEGNRFCELSEQDPDDKLSRAVTLFALALERLQSKVKSLSRKKSSEILMSAADGINLQLQNVKSQIQADVGKLTILSKSKRKRLETRFQEHQEKLKLIHEKFREEVNHHLQDCSSTLEGLEANKIEFKGTIERQKASHRKLLLQVEEAIESQLNDAERRITGVHKLASERMLELKQVIAECLMEGVLG